MLVGVVEWLVNWVYSLKMSKEENECTSLSIGLQNLAHETFFMGATRGSLQTIKVRSMLAGKTHLDDFE